MMKIKSIALLLSATCCVAMALPSMAQQEQARAQGSERQHKRMMWFEHIDIPHEVEGSLLVGTSVPPVPPVPPKSKRLTREDWNTLRTERLEKQFREFDLDQDGYISLAEMTEVMEQQARERAEKLFARLDPGHGLIDQETFAQSMKGARVVYSEEMRERMEQARQNQSEAIERMHIMIDRQNRAQSDEKERQRSKRKKDD